MPLDRNQIISEFKKYDPKRVVSEQDIANAQTHGLGVIKESFAGVGAGDRPSMTAGQQGQAAGRGALTQIEDTEGQVGDAIEAGEGIEATEPLDQTPQGTAEQMAAMTEEGGLMESMLQKALQAKQDEVAPIDEKRAEVSEKFGKLKWKDYAKLSGDAALTAIENDTSRLRSRIAYLDQQKTDAQAGLDDIVEQTRGMYDDKLSALGIRLQTEQSAVNFAFSNAILAAGVAPPDLPPEYQAVWKAASDTLIAQMAPKGGGGSRGSAKKDPFESDAKNLRQSMVMKEINWGIAFDFLKATYPEKTTEEIDAVLGGGGTYDAETDEWSYHGAAEKYGEIPKEEETEEEAPSWAAEEEK